MGIGFHHSEESKKKMSMAHKGKKLSEEHKRKISNSLKGQKKDPPSEEIKKKISNTLKGRKLSEQNKQNISKALTGRKLSDEHKRNLKKTMQTEEYKLHHHLGCVRAQNNPEVRAKVDKARAIRMENNGPTNIELKIMQQLNENHIDYIYQYYVFSEEYKRGFAFDFYIKNANIIIEADGDYWHGLDGVVKNDKAKNEYCKFKRVNLIRIKGSEILKKDFSVMEYLQRR